MKQADLDEMQDCLDAMSYAVRAAAAQEWSNDELWLEIEAQCQRLAGLSEERGDAADDDDEDEGEEEVAALNFDGSDGTVEDGDFEDDEDFN